jgi:hypothetical protein
MSDSRWLLVAVIGAAQSLAACAHVHEERGIDEEAEADDYYRRIVVEFLEPQPGARFDAEQLDFDRLRRGHSLVETDKQRARRALRAAEFIKARDDGLPVQTLAAAEALIALDFTDVAAHLEIARLLHDGRGDRARNHEAIARGFLRSIFEGYSREAPLHPLLVYSQREEDVALDALDLVRASSAGGDAQAPGGIHPVTCLDRKGRRFVVTFEPMPPTHR